jgi:hypothetical protein
LAKRLDGIDWRMQRLERDIGIALETRHCCFWLASTPSLPEASQAVPRAKARERYDGFLDAQDERRHPISDGRRRPDRTDFRRSAITTSAASAELTVVAASGRIVATRSDFNLRCDGSQVSISCLTGNLLVEQDGLTSPLGARQQVSYGD